MLHALIDRLLTVLVVASLVIACAAIYPPRPHADRACDSHGW